MAVVSTVNWGGGCPGGGCMGGWPRGDSPNFLGSSAIARSPYLKTAFRRHHSRCRRRRRVSHTRSLIFANRFTWLVLYAIPCSVVADWANSWRLLTQSVDPIARL